MMLMVRKDRMFRSLCLFATLFAVTFAFAQQKPVASTKAPAKPAAGVSNTPLPTEETVNAFLQATFGYQPQVTWKIADIKPAKAKGLAEVDVVLSNPQGQQQSVFYVTPDGTHAVLGQIIPFGAQPFEDDRKLLATKATGPSRGPADSPVTIVEFSDMQCPHCKAAQPTIDKLLQDEPSAKLVFQNFPLPMHDWAAKAAAYNVCIGKKSPDAFWKFVTSVYDQQANITLATADEKLSALADQAGVKGSEMAACAAQDDVIGQVQGEVLLGQSLEVTGTPTLFINGRRIADVGSLPYEVLKSLVDFAAKGGK
jgi:protein-disulfide isomerase